jgi:ATP-dependent DNA helicase UvrD/PcrA
MQRSRSTNNDPRTTIHEPRDFDFDQRPPDERGGGVAAGMRVRHPTFGVGVVRSCERTSTGHKVTVQFRDGAVKRLIAELAGLVPL